MILSSTAFVVERRFLCDLRYLPRVFNPTTDCSMQMWYLFQMFPTADITHTDVFRATNLESCSDFVTVTHT